MGTEEHEPAGWFSPVPFRDREPAWARRIALGIHWHLHALADEIMHHRSTHLERQFGRLEQKLEALMALNDAQQTELLDAVASLGADIAAAADRVTAAIESANVADPEVTQAIADLKALGDKADAIAAATPAPEPTPGP